ncbi:short-chain dehydrogenase [Rhizobium sp. Leaf311]|nr:short-chain dehydrogenase [Rhizobium sp. Leaf311]
MVNRKENAVSLLGTTVLVTGAGRGLGAALAYVLAENGCKPILAGRDVSALKRLSVNIQDRFNICPDIIQLDLSDTRSVDAAILKLRGSHDTIDILINNGAMWLEASDKDHVAQDVLVTINSAVTGTFLLTQGLLPSLLSSPRPDIVTIGSISGLPNAALQTVSIPMYAAKRGQSALAEGFAQMLARTPVRSIAIHPPYLDDIAPGTSEWEMAAARFKGQRGTNRDIAEAVLFAVTRPRHVTLSITVDADDGGLHPSR